MKGHNLVISVDELEGAKKRSDSRGGGKKDGRKDRDGDRSPAKVSVDKRSGAQPYRSSNSRAKMHNLPPTGAGY